jgi:hypothetical protein
MSSSSPLDGIKALSRIDQVLLGSGILVFIFSFFPYYGAKVSGSINGLDVGGGSSSVTAWHSYSTLALLLVLFGTIVAAAAILARGSLPSVAIGPRWIAAGLCALGALLYVIRLFTLPSHHVNFGQGLSGSEGVRWGGYLLLVIVLINAAAAVLGALNSDESKPWEQLGTTANPPSAPPAA